MIDEVCDKAFKILALTKSDTAAAQVSKAEKYIREHYGDPRLSLNMITEHLAISTSYFSAIFKSRTRRDLCGIPDPGAHGEGPADPGLHRPAHL